MCLDYDLSLRWVQRQAPSPFRELPAIILRCFATVVSPMKEEWNSMKRKPAAFTPITCIGADGREYAGLCFSTHRGTIIDPISNKDAEPVIGPMQGWRYQ